MAVVGTSLKKQQSQKFLCDVCAVSFANKWSYDRHLKKFHSELEIISGPKNITCGLCEDKVRNMTQLHKHILNIHPEVPLEFYTKEFYSMDDFKIWKKQFEQETLTCFTKRNGSKDLQGLRKEIYYCTRSGIGKIKDKHSRKRRSISGSVRTGITCPSVMRVTIEEVEDLIQITVSIQTTHIGHELEVEKLRVTGEDRKKLADLLRECGSFTNAMDKIQNELCPTQLSGLIKRQHLYNVKRDFKIDGIQNNIRFKRSASKTTNRRDKRKLLVGNSYVSQSKSMLAKPDKKLLVDKSSVLKSLNVLAKPVSPLKKSAVELSMITNLNVLAKQDNSHVLIHNNSVLEPMHVLAKQNRFLVDKSYFVGSIKVLAKPVSPLKQSVNELEMDTNMNALAPHDNRVVLEDNSSILKPINVLAKPVSPLKQSVNELEMDTNMNVLAKHDNRVMLEDNGSILEPINVLAKTVSPLKQSVIELKLESDLNDLSMYEVNVEQTEEPSTTDVWNSFGKLMNKVNTKEQLVMISETLSKLHSKIDLCGQI